MTEPASRPRLVVLQPSYLPWLGYFDQLAKSDVFIVYDDVLYTKNDWRNRNRVKSPQGPVWLTVPVEAKHRLSNRLLINQVQVRNDQDWASRHLKTLRANYARAPFFEAVLALLEPLLTRRWELLLDLNLALIKALAGYLGLRPDIRLASATGTADLIRSERLLALCRMTQARRYLSGDSARNYLDLDLFARHGVAVEWQDYRHPTYAQLWGPFIPYLSVVDLLFNHGPDSLALIVDRKEPTS